VHGTRNKAGLEVFRDCEFKSLEIEEETHIRVRRENRQERTRQTELLFSDLERTGKVFNQNRGQEKENAVAAIFDLV